MQAKEYDSMCDTSTLTCVTFRS